MKWFELINLGLNAAQLSELSELKGASQSMAEGQIIQFLEGERERILKSLIFASEQSALAIKKHLKKSPQPVLVGALLLQKRNDDLQVSQESFNNFDDKNYFKKTEDLLKKIKEDAVSNLSPKKIADAEKCALYIYQNSLLEEAVDWKKAENELKETDKEWSSRSGRQTILRLVSIGIFIVGIPTGCIASIFLAEFEISPIFSVMIFIFAIGGAAALFFMSFSKRVTELKKLRDAAKTFIPASEKIAQIKEIFGDMNSELLNSEFMTRKKFINKIMGENEDYDDFFLVLESE